MRLLQKQRLPLAPGLVGTARVGRRTRDLLPRLRPGDVAVLDHRDLDRGTAQALVDTGVAAVVNAGPMVSGRYPNLGPEVLARAGIVLVDGIGAAGLAAVPDSAPVRLHEGALHATGSGGSADAGLAHGRELDLAAVRAEMDAARRGLVTQLETFTHNSTELLRREEALLLHGQGLPRLGTPIAGRPVVVAVRGPELAEELRGLRAYLRQQRPVVVAVDAAADDLRARRVRVDVVVVTGAGAAGEQEPDRPSAHALRSARDVVLRVDGGSAPETDWIERLGVRAQQVRTGVTSEDAALLLADAGDPALIIGVGLHATLDDFLDRRRAGLASTFLTRLKVGPRLVDAQSVPRLYTGAVRPRHLASVLVAGLAALGAALATTPVGQGWAHDLVDQLTGLLG